MVHGRPGHVMLFSNNGARTPLDLWSCIGPHERVPCRFDRIVIDRCFLIFCQLKEFRRANEERYTHRYQSPYYLPHRDSTSLPQRDSDHSQQPPVITDNAQSLLGIQSSTLATQPRTDTASSGMNSSISLTSQNA